VPLGGNILYDQMQIDRERAEAPGPRGSGMRYTLTLPLDSDGQVKMESLTTSAYDHPAKLVGAGEEEGVPLLALFLDDELRDVFQVRSRGIRNGAISTPSRESALVLKRLLSSGPMPVKFVVDRERAFSPTMGAELRSKGLAAFLISILLLVVFVGLCYAGRPWFCVVYAAVLVFWFLCFVTMANLHWIRISFLQLAAFALLLGMNTDALILVFEDMRQEFGSEDRFSLSLVGEAFRTEWMVIFWGMLTTVVVILPMAAQGGVFADYVTLMLLGMGVNVLGFLFARVLMSLDIAEELSRLRIPLKRLLRVKVEGLADLFAKVDFLKFPYLPIGVLIAVLSIGAVFWFPRLSLAPVFSGGQALEVEFDQEVDVASVRAAIADLVESSAQIITGEKDGKTKWALVKMSPGAAPSDTVVLEALKKTTGIRPKIVSVQGMSKTLVAKTRFQVSGEMFVGLILLAAISLYIYNLFAGVRMMVALVHDILICLGCVAVLRISVDLPAIAAIATMAGYSINDSIVILHKLRIRKIKIEEKGELDPFDEKDQEVIASLPRENLRALPARVIITSVTTALPMVMLATMTGGAIREYAVIVLSGVLFGTLSSIYIVGRVVPWGFGRLTKA